MHLSAVAFVLAIAAAVQGAAVPASHVIHESREANPPQWIKRGRLSSGATLPLRIGLQQRNLHRGYELLMNV